MTNPSVAQLVEAADLVLDVGPLKVRSLYGALGRSTDVFLRATSTLVVSHMVSSVRTLLSFELIEQLSATRVCHTLLPTSCPS